MAKKAVTADNQQAFWSDTIQRQRSTYRTFWDEGDHVVDVYRLQKSDGTQVAYKDKFNILYSSTETIKPNLYATMPQVRVVMRNKDSATPATRKAALLLEGCLRYLMQEEDFNTLMDSVTEDYLLPGLASGWVSYQARFKDKKNDAGETEYEEDGKTARQELLDEMVCMDYVYWQDLLIGTARTWKDVPWIARRLWLTKEKAAERFGKEKAGTLSYMKREGSSRDFETPERTAEVWEIWEKKSRKVFWYADGQANLLDQKDDPLQLKDFWPCPKPLRAVKVNRTMIPRSLYSQYKSQAETLNVMTRRIRLLAEALRVVGLYDGSNKALADLLNANAGNRMIAVDNWAMFAQQGGVPGSVVWLPIDQIATVLTQLLQQREIAKQEIYEITGFSDVVRGVTKASETLGAQQLKANWAGARVKKQQQDVQEFARNMLALAGEVIAKHCSAETIAIFSGMSLPTPEEAQANPAIIQQFQEATALLKNDLLRVSRIDIETDSTLAADDEKDKAERAQLLAAAGAFLQQSIPAMEAAPELGSLLGAMLMFTVRSFPQSRIVEDAYEHVAQLMTNRPAPQPNDNGEGAKVQADVQKAQLTAQTEQAKLAQKQEYDTGHLQLEQLKEQNRHAEKMLELQLKEREVIVKEQELQIEKFTALHSAGMKEEEIKNTRIDAADARTDAEDARANENQMELDLRDREDDKYEKDREDRQYEAEAAREVETDRMDREDARAQDDREDAYEARQEAREDADEAASED